MKHLARILSSLLLVTLVVFSTSCDDGGEDKDSEEKTQLAKLAGTWNLSSVTLDATDRKADFANMQLILSGDYEQDGDTYDYNVTGSRPNPSPWPALGKWKFGNPVSSKIIRLEDGMEINYTVTGNQLNLEFTCSDCDFAGSRTREVSGEWNFVFTK